MKKTAVTLAALIALASPAFAGGHSNADPKGNSASNGAATATPDGLAGSKGVNIAIAKGDNADRD